ncbi:bifunctional demethylmenaquinone methyltransferase/2-methoxy-6-polyprenyl-1,4-benzoquinol methylase UbiE [Sulfurimonas sp. SWIR-19]|uniref:bifunctional demethylmenaquinone methyltransferase/2-methoxy-6-polyprenyl-1,4-benzoquinol methylase UbiE n=1 Tax=Sulfurimonas sp. SWIR-19 TaxID=2878390 RepID=UPI001CF2C7AD|nr:bifunctional demethylmenaquinone methyltransferase/2-methoxy-6-polyprenyl-1,4-benzoquinol methylase UbiE [Sulfurimonas sp. SWIR-19]UCN01035.1 bifunctional demethylmenaquinone methyltransferase/2-methoxy-6-polyprenyl-1,4-benzoquinol methylase UbiE [Sulfurimonas sp. SWIR-19]
MSILEQKDDVKQEKIVSMFDDIASTYDTANRVMSMGVDISWRKKACDLAFDYYGKKNIDKIVDVACGTGDMMGYWQKQSHKADVQIAEFVGVDPSNGMVDVARRKFPDFSYHIAKATQIPLEDASADMLSITYGIRNVVERQEAFYEFNRMLKKDGLVVILEFMKDENKNILKKIRDIYMHKILPYVGAAISKNLEAYTYLPDSIENFVTIQGMQKELENAGFEMLHTQSFSMDISTLIIARKK